MATVKVKKSTKSKLMLKSQSTKIKTMQTVHNQTKPKTKETRQTEEDIEKITYIMFEYNLTSRGYMITSFLFCVIGVVLSIISIVLIFLNLILYSQYILINLFTGNIGLALLSFLAIIITLILSRSLMNFIATVCVDVQNFDERYFC